MKEMSEVAECGLKLRRENWIVFIYKRMHGMFTKFNKIKKMCLLKYYLKYFLTILEVN